MSSRSRRSSGTGEWAAVDGHTSAGGSEGWSSVAYTHFPRHGRASPGTYEPARRRRRAATGRSPIGHARRRRLRLIDLALGLTLALVAILLAPGLAIVALLAAIGLLACAVSLAYGRVRRRRWAGVRRSPP